MRLKTYKFLIITIFLLSVTNFKIELGRGERTPIEITTDTIFSGKQTFILETFNVEADIIIDDFADIEFLACKFNFLSTTQVDQIRTGLFCNLTIEACEINGLESVETGNGEIYGSSVANNIKILDTTFSNFGSTNKQYAIYLPSMSDPDFSLEISGCTFIGTYSGIGIGHSNNTIIRSNYFHSYKDEGASMNAIMISRCANMIIEENTILGFNDGLNINDNYENITIFNNTIMHQQGNSFNIQYSQFIGTSRGLNITNNIMLANSTTFRMDEAPNSIVHNNTIYTRKEAMELSGMSYNIDTNKTITNNTFRPYDEVTKTDYIKIYGTINNWTFANNSIIFDNSVLVGSFLLFGDYVTIDNFVTDNSNTINGKPYIFLTSENDYTKSHNIEELGDISGIFSINNTGITIANSSLDNLLSMKIHLCNDLKIQNISTTDVKEAFTVSFSNNITISNSSLRIIDRYINSGFSIKDSNNVTLFNNSLINQKSDYISPAMSFLRSHNNTIRNCSVTGKFDRIIEMEISNNSFFENNFFQADTGFDIRRESYFNNFTHNEFFTESAGYFFDNDISLNTSFSENHWLSYLDAEDLNKDGFADDPYQFFYNGTDIKPIFIDSDGDGIDNFQEYYYGSDPFELDTDLDGLSDYDEIRVHFTNAFTNDTDGDLLSDFEEINEGIDGYITNPLIEDSDGDLFSDYEEYIAKTDPNDGLSFPGGIFNEENTENTGDDENNIQNTTNIPGLEIILGLIITPFIIFIIINSWLSKKKSRKIGKLEVMN